MVRSSGFGNLHGASGLVVSGGFRLFWHLTMVLGISNTSNIRKVFKM